MAVIRGYDIRERDLDYRSNYYVFRVPEPICAAGVKAAIEEARHNMKFEGCDQDYLEISMTGQEYFNLVDEYKKEGHLEAWDLARRIAAFGEGTYTWRELQSVFGSYYDNAIFEMPVEEALAKDKEYQKEKDALYVGDEVVVDTNDGHIWKGVVLNYTSDTEPVRVLCAADDKVRNFCFECVTKTGKHFDELVKLLAKMKEE